MKIGSGFYNNNTKIRNLYSAMMPLVGYRSGETWRE